MEEIFAYGLQPYVLRDADGQARVKADRSDILDASIHPIRQAGSSHPSILIHLAQALANLAPATRNVHQRNALGLAEMASNNSFAPSDTRDVVRAIEDARLELSSATQPRLQP